MQAASTSRTMNLKNIGPTPGPSKTRVSRTRSTSSREMGPPCRNSASDLAVNEPAVFDPAIGGVCRLQANAGSKP